MDPDKQSAYLRFLENQAAIGKGRGFERIGGYKKQTDLLKELFITELGEEKNINSYKKAKIPNVILFYGPTGTGKSSFTKAVAEQTYANIEKIEKPSGLLNREEKLELIMTQLKEFGAKSKKIYEDSGQDKTRTVIILDECNSIITKKNKKVDDFINFLKNCSDEYKCTVLLTTNHPQDLHSDLLNKEVTPLKIPLGPPDLEDTKAVLEKIFNREIKPIFDFSNVAQKLHSNPDMIYTNRDIDRICMKIFEPITDAGGNVIEEPKPTEKSFLDIIEKINKNQMEDKSIAPQITKQDMQGFQEDQDFFNLQK
jgi:cell division protease FtsH